MDECHAVPDLGYSSKILQPSAVRNNDFSDRLFPKSLYLLCSSLSYSIGTKAVSEKARK